ncbi:MAG: hypothetical protein IID46_02105 [Planctomycetes bacterium]|nr:hypothetical protein [Planctomycetota bacterium]
MQKALEALPGVVQARVDGTSKMATCYVKKEEFDVENALAVLTDAGYKNSTVESSTIENSTGEDSTVTE